MIEEPIQRALRCPKCHSTLVSDYVLGNARCEKCNFIFGTFDEKKDLFHRLWGIAARIKHYEKNIWNRLRELLRL